MKLLDKMKEQNKSYKEVAYKCEVDSLTVRNWCNGIYTPNIIREYKLAQILNTTVEEMNEILRETKGL